MSYFNETWFSRYIFDKNQVSNFVKIRPVGTQLLRPSGRAGGSAEATTKVHAVKASTWRCITPRPAALPLVEQNPSTHWAGGWVGPEYVKDIQQYENQELNGTSISLLTQKRT